VAEKAVIVPIRLVLEHGCLRSFGSLCMFVDLVEVLVVGNKIGVGKVVEMRGEFVNSKTFDRVTVEFRFALISKIVYVRQQRMG